MEYVNYELGLQYMGGYKKIYFKVLESFLETYRPYYEKELPLTREILHNLQGISMNLGAEPLYEIIPNSKELKKRIEICYCVFEKTYEELKEIYNKRESL